MSSLLPVTVGKASNFKRKKQKLLAKILSTDVCRLKANKKKRDLIAA